MVTSAQKTFAILLFVLGTMLNATMFGKVASHFAKFDKDAQKADVLRQTMQTMQDFDVPRTLQTEVLAFQHHVLYDDITSNNENFEALPETMRLQLSLYIRMKYFPSLLPSLCGRQGRGGGFTGWVIRIIFDPNTRQWGGGGFRGW